MTAPEPHLPDARTLVAVAAQLDDLAPAVVLSRLDLDAVAAALGASFEVGSAILTTGLAASPGGAVGAVYFSLDSALDALDRDEAVILAVDETTPADEPVMRFAEGVLTARGGLASHAAVVARGFGIPAVCGATALRFEGTVMHVEGVAVAEGTVLSIDGTTGEVSLGTRERTEVDPAVEAAVDRLLAAADEVRRTPVPGARPVVAVLANADTGDDARRARELGAEGIGLCRTEHMFLGSRLPLVQRAIVAATPAEESAALTELGAAQEHDVAEVLEAMDGLPVTIRLLDPPLHEFLPAVDDPTGTATAPDPERAALAAAAREWREVNPMLGTRGVRLALVRPGLYEMQARAVARAVVARRAAGGDPQVRLMVPLVSTVGELRVLRGRIDAVLTEELGPAAADVPIGTMIETPRAALVGGELASCADFFSFGTNDLTQLAWGFSRDDVEHRLLGLYQAEDVLEHSPFAQLDHAVAELVALGVARGRAVQPSLPVGVCGEHAGDPASLAALIGAGVDSVSCSPPRLRLARLAVGAAIAAGPR